MTAPKEMQASGEWRSGGTVVLAATMGYSMASICVGSIGVMMEPIESELGWSRTEIYFGVTLVSLVNMVLAAFIGLAIDRFGPRRIAIAACVLLLGGVASLSSIDDSLYGWWARWMLVGIGMSAMPTVWVVAVASRFRAARGLAVAIALSGSGFGTFLAPILADRLVDAYGWRDGYLGLAGIWAVMVIPLLLLFFRGADELRASPVEAPGTAQPISTKAGLNAGEGFTSATYYKLLIAGAGATFGSVALLPNMVPILTDTGITRTSAAAIAGLIGVATIVGRVGGGWLMDHFSAKWIAVTATASACILPLMLLIFPGSPAAAVTAILINGTMGGAKVGALAYLSSRHLGQRAFGTLYGTINAAIALSVALAPLAANYVYDVTKSYDLVMWAVVPVLLLCALLYASLGDYPDFERDREAAA